MTTSSDMTSTIALPEFQICASKDPTKPAPWLSTWEKFSFTVSIWVEIQGGRKDVCGLEMICCSSVM
ncbi:hypothetical protein D3C87_1810490 [compost metagenome]